MNPNEVIDNNCLLWELHFISTPYVSADTLSLLLEYGGNWEIAAGGKFFDDIDFDIILDASEQEDRAYYDSLVHYWMVLLGHGAKLSNSNMPVELFPVYENDKPCNSLFEISKLKNHRDYTFALTHTEYRGEKWSLHIIDKATWWEVARLGL